MPARTKQPSSADLTTDIPKIFDQVQVSTANHQKNYVALYKLHGEAARIVDDIQGSLTGERVFGDLHAYDSPRVACKERYHAG